MAKETRERVLRSGELARLAGVSVDTLRHYETKGVLARPPRSPNGYRQYPPEALARVRLVRSALAIGFTLDELAKVLRDRDRGVAPCHTVRRLAVEKLELLEERLRELEAMRDVLRSTIHEWDERLSAAGDGQPAGLLESLGQVDGRTEALLAPKSGRQRDSKRETRS